MKPCPLRRTGGDSVSPRAPRDPFDRLDPGDPLALIELMNFWSAHAASAPCDPVQVGERYVPVERIEFQLASKFEGGSKSAYAARSSSP